MLDKILLYISPKRAKPLGFEAAIAMFLVEDKTLEQIEDDLVFYSMPDLSKVQLDYYKAGVYQALSILYEYQRRQQEKAKSLAALTNVVKLKGFGEIVEDIDREFAEQEKSDE